MSPTTWLFTLSSSSSSTSVSSENVSSASDGFNGADSVDHLSESSTTESTLHGSPNGEETSGVERLNMASLAVLLLVLIANFVFCL